MKVLTSDDTYRLDPENAWMRLKTRSNDPRYFAVLKELAAWREREAQRRNTPRSRVLRDEQMFDIAAHRPSDADALGRTRGMSRDIAGGRIGQGILSAIEQGLAIPKADCPLPPSKPDLPNGLGPVIDLLKVLLKMKCEKYDVAQKLIANAADLEYIAADDNAPVAALSGWRREIFGEDALALKHGRLALTTRNRKVRVVPLTSHSETA
jgi:ribonuclease D